MASRNDKYIYLLIVKQADGKYFADVRRVPSEDNLVPIVGTIKNLYSVNVLPSKKARALAHEWNQNWKAENKLDYNIP